MQEYKVSLIGVPTDVGAGVRGASMGPEALRVAGLGRALAAFGVDVRDCGELAGPPNPELPAVDGFRHLAEVAEWNRVVHDAVHAELAGRRLPIVLGGDHCLAIGSISAVARHCRETGRKLRVLWFDAHADLNTPETTTTTDYHVPGGLRLREPIRRTKRVCGGGADRGHPVRGRATFP